MSSTKVIRTVKNADETLSDFITRSINEAAYEITKEDTRHL